jgi:hypothetical protein
VRDHFHRKVNIVNCTKPLSKCTVYRIHAKDYEEFVSQLPWSACWKCYEHTRVRNKPFCCHSSMCREVNKGDHNTNVDVFKNSFSQSTSRLFKKRMTSERLLFFHLYVLWVNFKLITATSARSATKHTASFTIASAKTTFLHLFQHPQHVH